MGWAARNVNSEEVLMAASAIQLVVDSRDSMPDMMPSGSTLDLVSSSSSLNNVVKQASESDDSLLAQTKSKVLADDNAVNQQRPAQLSQLYLFEPGYRSLAYDFYSDGFGTEFTNGQGGARSMSWVYEGNEITLTYDNLIVSSGIDMIDVDDDGIEDEVYFEIVQLSSDITFVSEREGFELVNITREFSKRYRITQTSCQRRPTITMEIWVQVAVPRLILARAASASSCRLAPSHGFYPCLVAGPRISRMADSTGKTLRPTSLRSSQVIRGLGANSVFRLAS